MRITIHVTLRTKHTDQLLSMIRRFFISSRGVESFEIYEG